MDKNAQFVFVLANKVLWTKPASRGAIRFDVAGVELLVITARKCLFEAILKKYGLTGDPARVLPGKIVNGADTGNTLWNQAEGPGLQAIAEGFCRLGFKDDHEINPAEWIVYDALYAYCKGMVRQARPEGMFKSITMTFHLICYPEIARTFAYGLLSVVFALYLSESGFSATVIGVLLSSNMIGDAVISLIMTARADRFAGGGCLLLALG